MNMEDEQFDLVINVNLKSVFLLTRAACRYMVRARYGRIVNIASVSGMMGNAGQANYAASKGGVIALTPGLYGLSNHLLDTPWPKVARGKEALGGLLSRGEDPAPEALFDILSDRTIAEDRLLPDTGVGLDWERILSARFITSPVYGTRSSTLLYVDRQDRVTFIERNFNAKPGPPGTARFEFAVSRSDADRG